MDPGYSTGLLDSLQRAATEQADSSLYLHKSREKLISGLDGRGESTSTMSSHLDEHS